MPHQIPMFVGCATDSRFVEPTAVMLTSLEANGQVPEAGIIVAGFDLGERDRVRLRVGAGRMSANMRFLDVTREMLHLVDPDGFTDEYPPSVLGRLFVADHITVPGARLLTLDSDMIVNSPLRPLFDLNLGHEYFAAIHDPPRKDDPNYFNSGLTLCNVDRYRYFDVARRSLRYIAEHQPHFPDQDALNAVVGNSWHRLNRLWNYFYSGDRDFVLDDYEHGKVAHFCGWKPWDHADHPAAPLYARYLRIFRDRLARSGYGDAACGADFVATSYEVLLGRQAESDDVVRHRSGHSRREVLRTTVQSDEFDATVLAPMRSGRPVTGATALTRRQRIWASEQLPLTHETSLAVLDVTSRPHLLTLCLRDPLFAEAVDLPPEVRNSVLEAVEPIIA